MRKQGFCKVLKTFAKNVPLTPGSCFLTPERMKISQHFQTIGNQEAGASQAGQVLRLTTLQKP